MHYFILYQSEYARLDSLPVSQRRNDEPFSAAQELVLVDKTHVCDVDNHLVRVLIKVETALLQPLKVTGAFDVEPALGGEKDRRESSAFRR